MRAYASTPGPGVPFTAIPSANTVLTTVHPADDDGGDPPPDDGGSPPDDGGDSGGDGEAPPPILPPVEIVVHPDFVPESGDPAPENLVLYPGSTTRLAIQTEATGVDFRWSCSPGLDVDQSGNVRAWRTGTMSVVATGAVTIEGQSYELSDSVPLPIYAPTYELSLPEGEPVEGHDGPVTAEAYPALGDWTDWQLAWGADLATVAGGPNCDVQRDAPAPGSVWRQGPATLAAAKPGPIVVQASYVIPHPTDHSKDYVVTSTVSANVSRLSATLSHQAYLSIGWPQECPEPDDGQTGSEETCTENLPDLPDSDGDNFADCYERYRGTDPNDPTCYPAAGSECEYDEVPPDPDEESHSPEYLQGYADGYCWVKCNTPVDGPGPAITDEYGNPCGEVGTAIASLSDDGLSTEDSRRGGLADGYFDFVESINPSDPRPPRLAVSCPCDGGDGSVTPPPDDDPPPDDGSGGEDGSDDDDAPQYCFGVQVWPPHAHAQITGWIIDGEPCGPSSGSPLSISADPDNSMPEYGYYAFTLEPTRRDWAGWVELQAVYTCGTATGYSDRWPIRYDAMCHQEIRSISLDTVVAEGHRAAGEKIAYVLAGETLPVTANTTVTDSEGNAVSPSLTYHWTWTPRETPVPAGETAPSPGVELVSGLSSQTASFRFNKTGTYTIACCASDGEGNVSPGLAPMHWNDITYWRVRVTVHVGRIDLAIDSNNDGTITTSGNYPANDDLIEEQSPGKTLLVDRDLARLQVSLPHWDKIGGACVTLVKAGGGGNLRVFPVNPTSGEPERDSPISSGTDLWPRVVEAAGQLTLLAEGATPGLIGLEARCQTQHGLSSDRAALNVVKIELLRHDGTPLDGSDEIRAVDSEAFNVAWQAGHSAPLQIIQPELIHDAFYVAIRPVGHLSATTTDRVRLQLLGLYGNPDYEFEMTETGANTGAFVGVENYGLTAPPTLGFPLDQDDLQEGALCQVSFVIDHEQTPYSQFVKVVKKADSEQTGGEAPSPPDGDDLVFTSPLCSAQVRFASGGQAAEMRLSASVAEAFTENGATIQIGNVELEQLETNKYASQDGNVVVQILAATDHAETARDSLALAISSSSQGIKARAWLVETTASSGVWSTSPAASGSPYGGASIPYPDPGSVAFKVRYTDLAKTDDELDYLGFGETDTSKVELCAIEKLLRTGDGVYESKPTFAVRNIDRLLPQVREQLQDYDFVKGDGSELLAWTAGVLKSTIPGTECVTLVAVSKLLIAGGAVIAVGGELINAIEDEHEDWQVKGILKGPKAPVKGRMFRICDSAASSWSGYGWHWNCDDLYEDQWALILRMAKNAGYDDAAILIGAEQHQILQCLRDMDGDDIFVFHGHASAKGLLDHDRFGLRDVIDLREIESAIGKQGPRIVVLSGCHTRFSYSTSESSLVRTFLDAVPTEHDYVLLLGYNETVHPEVARAATQVLLTSLMSGATVSAAVGLANECYEGQYERLKDSLGKKLGYRLGKVSARLEATSRQDDFQGMRLPQLVPDGNGEDE